MSRKPRAVLEASARIVREVRLRREDGGPPFIVAVDGRSGAGKSAIAETVATGFDAGLVPTDDFFRADLSDVDWERRSPEARARDCIDWRRLRRDVLEPLRSGEPAEWNAFDFEAGPRPDGSYPMRPGASRLDPRPAILLDGAYSARPELADLIDLTVLVRAPAETRRTRLRARENPALLEEWHRRWDDAEAHYFDVIRPLSSFDIVVDNS